MSGWTSLSGVSGFGHHGTHEGRLLSNDRAGLVMVIAVLPSSGPSRSSSACATSWPTGPASCSSVRPG
ncbi:hypothetical protein V2I01_31815 [Micromonospora sp. BRA006-A]|nr:hypothetical protein [Micromonospora sp. BRA006-A]